MRVSPLIISVILFFAAPAFAAQEAIQAEKTEQDLIKEKALRQRIETPIEEAPEVEQPAPEVNAAPVEGEEKAEIVKITVVGVTLLPESEITAITAQYENKLLTLSEMQKVADLITDAYRQKGYATSRAFLPPQKIKDNILEIRVIEGVVGDVEVRDSRYFRESFIRSAVKMDKGQPFNANRLRYYLSRLNEHPDRNVKAVLAPGKEPGTTDIVLQVQDRLPIHAELGYDNYGSRYLRKNRYSLTLTDNNLLGVDDILSVQWQGAEGEDSRLLSARYLFPVNDWVKLGAYAAKSNLALGKEFREVMARGKSETYSVYSLFELVREDTATVTVNTGFDYKDSVNLQMTDVESKDRMRVARVGVDVDYSDEFMGGGRNIISPEADFGIPGILGGSESKDEDTSRQGAGGDFTKYQLSLLRLQKLPFDATLLWKNSAQLSSNVLTATEQFQLGGISNVRGYPSANNVGDEGYATTFEFSVPPYGLSRSARVPFVKDKFYDALRFALFYDWGYVKLHRPQAGEQEDTTLAGAGFGIRFNLTNSLSIRADFAWPLMQTPVDEVHFHPWFQVSQEF